MKIRSPCESTSPDKSVIYAVQSLATGTATEHQQKLALDWIITEACATYDQSYRPGVNGDRDTCFAEGRRFVGNQIIRLTKLDPKKGQKKQEQNNGRSRSRRSN